MNKTYQPHEIEQRWYQQWEQSGYFKPNQGKEAYCIMLPPPNVTGTLHMGHGFQVSLMDAMIRYQRMSGKNTLWQAGTDHAGIATQMVVETRLAKEGVSRHDLGREKFLDKVWDWKKHSDSTIKNQLRRMGASLDWTRERFTMDPGIENAVLEVFIKLYDEGLIYRGQTLVNWDPELKTAVSDLEVDNKEENGKLWHIKYPIKDSDEFITVATTRPETILGDAAVAVHPDDERYQHLVGQYVLLPLTEREIPIIKDHFVEAEFGTGCVKITPAHDFDDYEVGKRHDLPLINILTEDAKINSFAPVAYQGMDRFVARKQIVKDLEAINLIADIEDYKVKTPRGDRSGTVIEPYLTDQWFVKAEPLAKPAIEAVKKGEIQFVPENWNKIYFQWLEDIQDWCISRQLWWGHRIPAWYDNDNNIYVGRDQADVRQKYNLESDVALRQDDDVLDTWFSSALWPFATLDWPNDTPEFNTFYPTNVLVTGFDIIFFWVARMVMMGLKFTGKVPFNYVYITGLIRDSEGNKMSKSKGNVLDPIDLIDGIELEPLVKKRTENLLLANRAKEIEEKTRKEFPNGIAPHGTDALRFTYCALATHGRDIRFDLSRLEGYRNFTNKIWNAARFVMMNTEDHDLGATDNERELNIIDRWILTRLHHAVSDIHRAFEEYRFDRIAKTLHEFIWHEYCDWYLEFSKTVLLDDAYTDAQKRGTRHTLINVLEIMLRLAHPIMPYITEEIWQKVAPLIERQAGTIMTQDFPQPSDIATDESSFEEIEWLKNIIAAIRNIRGEMNISPAKQIPLLLDKGAKVDRRHVEKHQQNLMMMAKVSSIDWLDGTAPAAATALIDSLEVLIPMADLIDTDAELERLSKELGKLEKDLTKAQTKLSNPSFVDKAPAAVVEQEKARVTEISTTIDTLKQKIDSIQAMAT